MGFLVSHCCRILVLADSFWKASFFTFIAIGNLDCNPQELNVSKGSMEWSISQKWLSTCFAWKKVTAYKYSQSLKVARHKAVCCMTHMTSWNFVWALSVVLINWCKGHLNLAWWMDWKCSWFDQITQHVGLWTWWKRKDRKASGTDTIRSFGLKNPITPHEIPWIESTGTPLRYISGSRLRCRTCARWCSRFAQEWWQWWVPFWAPKRTTTGSITSGAPSPSRWELPRSGWISRVGKPQAQRRVCFLESVWNMLYFVLAKRRFKDVKWYDVTSTLNLGELMRMTDIVLLL